MVNRPTKPFGDAVQNIEPQSSELTQEELLKLNPARDKTNTAHVPKPPSFAMGGATNTTPRGTVAYQKPEGQTQIQISPDIDITKGYPEKDLFIHGNITSMEGYTFVAKVYDLPSEHGIENGKISKLQIKHGDRIAVNFERGWDIKPETAKDREALEKVRNVFDPPDKEFQPIAPKTPDKDHGHER